MKRNEDRLTQDPCQMLEKISGSVRSFKPLTTYSVQVQLDNYPKVIELNVSTPWVVRRRDTISFAGEVDAKTGKFMAYAYKNETADVAGSSGDKVSRMVGGIFTVIGFVGAPAIFPLIFAVVGMKVLTDQKKFAKADELLHSQEHDSQLVLKKNDPQSIIRR